MFFLLGGGSSFVSCLVMWWLGRGSGEGVVVGYFNWTKINGFYHVLHFPSLISFLLLCTDYCISKKLSHGKILLGHIAYA